MRFIYMFFLVVVQCVLVTVSGTGEGQYHPGLDFQMDGSDEDADLDGFEISDSRIMRSYLIEDEEYFDYMCWKYGYGSYYNDTSLLTYPAPNLNCPHTETIWRHLHDCSKYLICEPKTKHGTNISHAMFSCKCEDSELFSMERGNCERKDKVADCLENTLNYDTKILQAYVVSADSVKPTANVVNLPIHGHGINPRDGEKISQLDSECIYMGKFPLENYCDRYIQCKTGPDGKLEAHLHICPKRKHYSKNYRICMHPHLARCPYGGEDLAISSKGSSYDRATIPTYQGSSGSATNPPQLMVSDSRSDYETDILEKPKTESEPDETAVVRPEIYSTHKDYKSPPHYKSEERENSYKAGAGRRIAGRTHDDDLEDLDTNSNSGGNYKQIGHPLKNGKNNAYQKVPIKPFKKGPRKLQSDHDIPEQMNYVSKAPFTYDDHLKHDTDKNKYTHGGGSSKDNNQTSKNEYRRTNRNNYKNNYDAPRNYIIVSPFDQKHLQHNYDMSRLIYTDENPPTHKKHELVHADETPPTATDEDIVFNDPQLSPSNSPKYEPFDETHNDGAGGPTFRDHEELDIGEAAPPHVNPQDEEYKDQLVSTDHNDPVISSTKYEPTTQITKGLLTSNETENLSFSQSQKYQKNKVSSNDKESNHAKNPVQNKEDATLDDLTTGPATSLVPGNNTPKKPVESGSNSPAYVDDQGPPQVKQPAPSSTETDQENPAAGTTAKNLPALPKKRPALLFKDDEKPLELHDDFGGYFDKNSRKKPSKKLSSKDQGNLSPVNTTIASPGRGKKLPGKKPYDATTAANKSTVLPVRGSFKANKENVFVFPKEDALDLPDKKNDRDSFKYKHDAPPHFNPGSGVDTDSALPKTENLDHNKSPGSPQSTGKFVFDDGKHTAFGHNDKEGTFEPPVNHDEEFAYNKKEMRPQDIVDHMNRNAHTEYTDQDFYHTDTAPPTNQKQSPSTLFVGHETEKPSFNSSSPHGSVKPSPLSNLQDADDSARLFHELKTTKDDLNKNRRDKFVFTENKDEHPSSFSKPRPSGSGKKMSKPLDQKSQSLKNKPSKNSGNEYGRSENENSKTSGDQNGPNKNKPKNSDNENGPNKNKLSKTSGDEYGRSETETSQNEDDKFGHPKTKPSKTSGDENGPNKNKHYKALGDEYGKNKNKPSKTSGGENGQNKNKPFKNSDNEYDYPSNKPSKYADDKYGRPKHTQSKNSDDKYGHPNNKPSKNLDDKYGQPNSKPSKSSDNEFGHFKNKPSPNSDDEYDRPKNIPSEKLGDENGRSKNNPSKNSAGQYGHRENKPINSDDEHVHSTEETFKYQNSGPLDVKDSKQNALFAKDSQQQNQEPSYNDEGPPQHEAESPLNTEHKPPSHTNEKFEFSDHPLPIHAEYERGHSEKGPQLHETPTALATEKERQPLKNNDKESPFLHEKEQPLPNTKGTQPLDDHVKQMTSALDHIHYIDHKLATEPGSKGDEEPPRHIDPEFHHNTEDAPKLQNPGDFIHSNQGKPSHDAPNDLHSYKPQTSQNPHDIARSDNEAENPEILPHKSNDPLLAEKEHPRSQLSLHLGQHSYNENEQPEIPDEKFEKPKDLFKYPTERLESREAQDPEYSGEDSLDQSDHHPLYNDEELSPHSLKDAAQGQGPNFRSHSNYESQYSEEAPPEHEDYMFTDHERPPYEDNHEPFYNDDEPIYKDDEFNPFSPYQDSEPEMGNEPLVHYNYKLDHNEEELPRDEHYDMPYETDQEGDGYIETPGYSDSDKSYSPFPLGKSQEQQEADYPHPYEAVEYSVHKPKPEIYDSKYYENENVEESESPLYTNEKVSPGYKKSPVGTYQNSEPSYNYNSEKALGVPASPSPASVSASAYERQEFSFPEASYPSKQSSDNVKDSFYSEFPPEQEYEEPLISESPEFENVNDELSYFDRDRQDEPVFANDEPILIEDEGPYNPLDEEDLVVNKNNYKKFRSFYN